jgi:hypothetical protein
MGKEFSLCFLLEKTMYKSESQTIHSKKDCCITSKCTVHLPSKIHCIFYKFSVSYGKSLGLEVFKILDFFHILEYLHIHNEFT